MFTPFEKENDPGDQAKSIEQFDVELAIHKAKQPEATRLRRTGRCHNCNAPGIEGVFCDDDCAEDYEKRERNKIGR